MQHRGRKDRGTAARLCEFGCGAGGCRAGRTPSHIGDSASGSHRPFLPSRTTPETEQSLSRHPSHVSRAGHTLTHNDKPLKLPVTTSFLIFLCVVHPGIVLLLFIS
ncbi:hypothetical protein E2C01_001847 [Portunus trituberculatus]|uniref:Uncharacterized protein n=1 Tax=Portunus trituberculatus TaxID=210409 RepID=A0A5B7CKJ7_PORTR|nr:hypothetical protein [Portunus trituberculatus]